jgi:2-methylaconitate cis-trans-isomerase PrpF
MMGKIAAVIAAAAVTMSLAVATPAIAKDGVVRTGACSGASDWKLKVAPDNGRLELEFEVDSNKVGQTWRVRIFHDGVRIFAGKRLTKAPSGSFTVRLFTPNHAGTDHFRARAVNLASSETCLGKASI